MSTVGSLSVDSSFLSTQEKQRLKRQQKREQELQEKKQKAKLALTGKIKEETGPDPAILAMALTYENAMCAYTKSPGKSYLKKDWMTDSSSLWRWKKCVEIAASCGVDAETYMKAQFWFCNKVLGRAPKQQELTYVNTNVPCSRRVELYLEAIAKNEVSNERYTVTPVQKVEVAPQIKHLQSERALKDLMRNLDLSEEEVFLKFARAENAAIYFDLNWLAGNEVYRSLKEQNKLG